MQGRHQLPFAARGALAREVLGDPGMTTSRPASPLIAVADDRAEMCELLADLCRDVGDVVALPGGRLLHGYLMASVRGEVPTPKLVVSDVRMPAFGGLNALKFISDHLPETSVILVTAFGDAALHAQAKRRGAVSVLNKPFTHEELHDAIQTALYSSS